MEPPKNGEAVVDRRLSYKETKDAIAKFRRRLMDSLRDHPKARVIISNPAWNKPPETESVSWPDDQNPQWVHTFSRISPRHFTIKSQSPLDPDLIEESLDCYDDGPSPAISFTRAKWEQPSEVYDSRTKTLPEADAFVTRIETQLGTPPAK